MKIYISLKEILQNILLKSLHSSETTFDYIFVYIKECKKFSIKYGPEFYQIQKKLKHPY